MSSNVWYLARIRTSQDRELTQQFYERLFEGAPTLFDLVIVALVFAMIVLAIVVSIRRKNTKR